MGQIFSDDILELIGPHLVREQGSRPRRRPIPVNPSPTLELLGRLQASTRGTSEGKRLDRTVKDAKTVAFSDGSAESVTGEECAQTAALMVKGLGIGGSRDLMWRLSILLAEVMGNDG